MKFHWIAAMTLAMTWATATQDAIAQISTWVGGTGSWFDAGNWSLGSVPNENVLARISNGSEGQILVPGANAEAIDLGDIEGERGALGIRGEGYLQLRYGGGGRMTVGRLGTGTLNVVDGATLLGRNGIIGAGPVSTGTATVAGSNASWSNLEYLYVGVHGIGTLDILRGGLIENTVTPGIDQSVIIGDYLSGRGTVNVDGANSKFLNTKDLFVGNGGLGEMNISNGAEVTNFNGNLGVQSGSSGTVNVDGPGSTWNNSSVVAVGVSGAGVLNVTGGGAVTSTNGRIAREYGSTGTVSVSGMGSSWTASGDLSVGNSGAGTLTIDGGASVSNFNGNIGVNGPSGIFSAGNGTVNVRGAGSQWSNGVVAVGVSGRGQLTITDGAVVTSTNGRIAREAGSTGTVSVSGTSSWWANTGVLTIGLAGTGFAQLAVNSGGLVSAAGGITIGPLGAVSGDGTLGTVGGPPVTNGGLVAPGNSPGTMYIQGSFTQTSGGTLEIEIGPSANDKLDVRGVLTIGGTLDVSLPEDYVPSGTLSFDILDWTGGLSGAFSTIQLPTLDGPLAWDTSQLYTTGVLTVTGPELAGDFNDDAVVDAADYVVWRSGLGSLYAQADYDVWRASFGRTLGSGSLASGAVPEPAALCVVIVGVIAVLALRSRGATSMVIAGNDTLTLVKL